MKMKITKITAAVLAILMTVLVAACGAPAESETARIAALKGPTAMGMVNLMEEENAAREYSLYATADEITAGLISGSIDIAALPCNLAATLYNNTNGKVRVAAVNTLGVLYIMESGDTVASLADLDGKTVYSTGKGTTPEYVLNYILKKNGLENVTVEYKSEAAEVAALLAADEGTIAMLPQPYAVSVLAKNKNVRIALDVTELWNKTGDTEMVTGVLVARSEYIESNPDSFGRFLDGYKNSCALSADTDKTAALCVKQGIVASEAVARAALPYCNIKYIDGDEMKNAVSAYLNVLYAANAASIGGKLPDDNFYFIGK